MARVQRAFGLAPYAGRRAARADQAAPTAGPLRRARVAGPGAADCPPAGSVLGQRARRPGWHPSASGFTLLEVLIALAIVAALLVVALGGFRVALAAWTRGESHAEAHQRARSLAALLNRTIAGAYPYRMTTPDALEPVIVFDGRPDQLSFATAAPPVPLAPIIAYTAVRLSVDHGEDGGLAVREYVLPNADRFGDVKPQFREPSVTGLKFRYRSPEETWEDTWDATEHDELPVAVEVTVETIQNGRVSSTPPIIVSLKTTTPSEAQ